MNNWLLAGWRGFLSDRVRLYEHLEYAALYGGTVTSNTGLNRLFADYICYEIDSGLAQYRLWYLSRIEARQKVGKSKWEAKYKTLNDVLGVTESLRRGGYVSGVQLTEDSQDYKQAVIAAMRAGKPIPDIVEWTAALNAPQGDES